MQGADQKKSIKKTGNIVPCFLFLQLTCVCMKLCCISESDYVLIRKTSLLQLLGIDPFFLTKK